MRKVFIVLILCFNGALSFGQVSNQFEDTIIYSFPDQNAEFVGGQDQLGEYIFSNFRPPMYCVAEKINLEVIVRFVVEKDGSISNAVIEKNTEYDLFDRRALDIFKTMPKWIPASNDGKAVRVYVRIPIQFEYY